MQRIKVSWGLYCLMCIILCVSSEEIVKVKTRKLWSKKGMPFGFYSLPFCRPESVYLSTETIGEALFGDRIENSVFNFEIGKEITCQLLNDYQVDGKPVQCPKELSTSQIRDFIGKINLGYDVQLIVDKLPVANRGITFPNTCETLHNSNREKFYHRPDGFPLGCVAKTDQSTYINNHWAFTIKYHVEKDGRKSIVGAEAVARSIDHDTTLCSPQKKFHYTKNKLKIDEKTRSIPWSFSVDWEESDIEWSSRWDAYTALDSNDSPSIHWFSITNATMVVILLTSMIGTILYRILSNQIHKASDDDLEETGWKLLYGDVFRPPRMPMVLSMLYGSGVQISAMTFLTIGFAMLGMANPANRGQLITIMFGLFALLGSLNGYFTLRMYKMMSGKHWKTATLLSGLFFPGVVFLTFFITNIIVWFFTRSSAAILPVLSLLKIFALWTFVQVPLVCVGGYIGYKRKRIENPCEVRAIPKKIPSQPWYLSTVISAFVGGLLPFGAVFIEVYFLMSSVWLHKFYVLFGFLFLVFIVMMVTSAEISIVIIYFQLCSDNHEWHWRSFLISGASSFYLFGYSILYFYKKLHITGLMTIIYFEYMAIISWLFFLMTGSAGFIACFWFIRKIYSSVRSD